MKINKKFFLIISLVLAMSVLTACGNKSEFEENSVGYIKDNGKLKVGTSADYPPYEFHALIDGKDEIVGFDMALANYIAEELEVELEIVEMDFKNLVGSLPTGKIDMVIAAMTPGGDRDLNFSDIYYEATHGILVRKDKIDLIKTEEDLKNKKVGVQMGSVQEEIASKIEGADLTSLSLTNNLIMELLTEKVDYIVMEKPVAQSYASTNEDLVLVPGIELVDEDGGGSAVAMKKGNDELTEKVNEILKKVKQEKLMDEWVIEANEILNNSRD